MWIFTWFENFEKSKHVFVYEYVDVWFRNQLNLLFKFIWYVVANSSQQGPCSFVEENVPFQTSLEKNPSNSSYIFWLDVNFENLTIRLYVLIISFTLAKFQENHKLIAMLPKTCLNFKFLWLKIMHKKCIYWSNGK